MAEAGELVVSSAQQDDMLRVVAALAGILERVAERNDARARGFALAVDSYSVHRLLITTVLAAVKFMDDVCYNNAYFAKVGGISLVEMNYLEVDFLFGVGFDLNVTPETFGHYCAVLQSEMLCAEAASAPPRLQHCCLSESEDDAASCGSQQQLAA
ncbi:hypothetical protein TRIUR3_19932 [Triticum urartu]|uniref:Cyclin n=2 Tax=Triticum TaxID=4564 RepID=A0A9R0Y357_TRITD|nr:hypothetical protein TRIUR3_19932 [Triticum urartu]VAI47596.1 unnamed protein product [Triticum turgidum subsp. durum]